MLAPAAILALLLLAANAASLQRRNEEFLPFLTADFPHLIGISRLTNWADPALDPCADFYAYSCGRFLKRYEPLGSLDILQLMRQSNALLVQQILNRTRPANADSLLAKIQAYHRSCSLEGASDSRGVVPLVDLAFDILAVQDDFARLIGLAHARAINVVFRPMFSKIAAGDPHDLRLQLVVMPAYRVGRETIGTVLVDHLAPHLPPPPCDWDRVVDFVAATEQLLVRFVEELRDSRPGPPSQQYHTRKSLRSATDGIDWEQYARAVRLDRADRFYLPIHHGPWLRVLSALHQRYRSSHLARRLLPYFVLWRAACSHYDKLSDTYRQFLIDEILPHRVKAVEDNMYLPTLVARDDCLDELGMSLPYLTGHVLTRYAFNATQKRVALDLINHLFDSFRDNVAHVDWMDADAKRLAIEKLDKMVKIVGYPDWVADRELVMEYHQSLVFNASTYFENAVQAALFRDLVPSIHQLRHVYVDRENVYIGHPWQPNAFHLSDLVQVQINQGFLQRPLFSMHNPSSMNYGSLGMIIGHEITHGFDESGFRLDANGMRRDWTHRSVLDAFKARSQCFRDQYAQYSIPLKDGSSLPTDADRTLGENMADNGGLHVAYDAWLRDAEQHGVDPFAKTEDYGGYTPEQTFFMAFAQTWCSARSDEQLRERHERDVHSPNAVRVKGVLHNTPQFAKAFQCPVGSAMNPKRERCVLF